MTFYADDDHSSPTRNQRGQGWFFAVRRDINLSNTLLPEEGSVLNNNSINLAEIPIL